MKVQKIPVVKLPLTTDVMHLHKCPEKFWNLTAPLVLKWGEIVRVMVVWMVKIRIDWLQVLGRLLGFRPEGLQHARRVKPWATHVEEAVPSQMMVKLKWIVLQDPNL